MTTKTAAPAGTVIATITREEVTLPRVLEAVQAAGYPCSGIEGDTVQFYLWNDDDIRAKLKLMEIAKWAGREFRPTLAAGIWEI